jgi:VWFA-related protein
MMTSLSGVRIRSISIIGILWLCIAPNIQSQEHQNPSLDTSQNDQRAENEFKIKVGIEEVRLDAVVVDKKGRQVTDLTGDDFEIYQDGRQQEIIGYKYIAHTKVQPGQRIHSSPEFGVIPPVPAPLLKRNNVQRTIIFLVNDFGMKFEETYRARMSLQKYVEEQMMPGDLVSIIKTSRGNATLQAFTSDKRELLSRIDAIQWSTYNDLQSVPLTVDVLNTHNSQLIAMNYCIKALQNMPGRKYLMLLTYNAVGPPSLYPTYDRMADAALRAGVVVHTMDIRGLRNRLTEVGLVPFYVRRTYTRSVPVSGGDHLYYVSGVFDRLMDPEYLDYQSLVGSGTLPLSQKTGGLYLENNFFINGIGDLEEEMRGYYLLSYIPPPNTFSKSGGNRYHDIKIEVKRKGVAIHTRDGFMGNPAALEAPTVTPPPLVEAMFSPFQYNDLNVTLASGYIDNLKKGYLLPTWMHLDGQDLSVKKEEDGSYSVSFEVGASTTDSDGLFQEYGDMQIGFKVDEKDIRKLKENGINFTVSIPVKKPGSYYVRVAVKDQFTDAKGSAYQFVEIPDLKKKRLALSSLYIIDSEEDSSWIRSMATDPHFQTNDFSQRIKYRNPARKSFLPGENFEYMTVIYNAKTKKANPPDLQSQVILYRNGVELHKSKAEAVELNGMSDFKRIPIRRKFQLEDSMQPGEYVLQFLVRDNEAKEKENLTAQTLSFRVTER